MPNQLNWWIGCIFATGSLLFITASLLSLSSGLAAAWSLDELQINALFFAGSIPFTTAAYLQLFQAANADPIGGKKENTRVGWTYFGWLPRDIGWLSCALQFVGTLLFNVNTWDAMIPSLDWLAEDLLIWVPDLVGSILFLASGYLAFAESCNAHWRWKPKSLSWCVVFVNLIGCLGFMISALFAFVLPATHPTATTFSLVFTLVGAIGFFIGSLLMLPESAVTHDLDA